MFLPTIPLKSIMQKWRDALLNSAEISAFCLDKYGKAAKIYVGFSPQISLTEKDCPFIVIFSGSKTEGADTGQYQYTVKIGWCIRKTTVTSAEAVELEGVYETDDLGQLILQAVAEINPNYPVSQVDYNIEIFDYIPQFPGTMEITLTIPLTTGAALEY